MEDQERNKYLPIEVKNNSLLIQDPNTMDRIKKVLKVMGGIGVGLGGIVLGAVSRFIPVPALATAASTVGFATTVYGFSGSAINAVFRRDRDLMFEARKKLDGRLYFFQKVDSFAYARGLTPYEKAGLMTLNTVIGIERFQTKLEKKMAIQEDGKNVYPQGFGTKTHALNIKNFKILEELGYITIDSIEDSGKSNLLVEKMTVGNTRGLRESIARKEKVEMQTIKFRITDKKLSLTDFYIAHKTGNYRAPGERRITTALFDEKYGILRDNNPRGIAVGYDQYGREIIQYKSKKPGLDAIKEHPYVVKELGQKDTDEFIDRIFVDEKEQAEADIENRRFEERMKNKFGLDRETKDGIEQEK